MKIVVPKASELIARELRARIADGRLKPGDRLPAEHVLMEEFGVSRPTLREAFRVLESEALISVRRGATGGATVQEPSVDGPARQVAFLLEMCGASARDVRDAIARIDEMRAQAGSGALDLVAELLRATLDVTP